RNRHRNFDPAPFAISHKVRRQVPDRVLAPQLQSDLFEGFVQLLRIPWPKGSPAGGRSQFVHQGRTVVGNSAFGGWIVSGDPDGVHGDVSFLKPLADLIGRMPRMIVLPIANQNDGAFGKFPMGDLFDAEVEGVIERRLAFRLYVVELVQNDLAV